MTLDDSFRTDVKELLEQYEQLMLSALEKEFLDREGINAAFRVLHTIKGAAYMFNHKVLGDFTHQLEEFYEEAREKNFRLSVEQLQLSITAGDLIRSVLEERPERMPDECYTLFQNLSSSANDSGTLAMKATYCLVEHLDRYQADHPFKVLLTEAEEIFEGCSIIHYKSANSCIAIYFDHIDKADDLKAQLLFMEEVEHSWRDINPLSPQQISAWKEAAALTDNPLDPEHLGDQKPPTPPEAQSDQTPEADPPQEHMESIASNDGIPQEIKTIKVPYEKVEELMNWVSELVTLKAQLSTYSVKNPDNELHSISKSLQTISQTIQDLSFEIGLVPLKPLANRVQRLVHDLSVSLKKPVQFKSDGMATTVGKEVLEQLFDPLMHLVRNAVDHGIEPRERRESLGKPAKGLVTMTAKKDASHLTIRISDDGRGMDKEKIIKKAMERELISNIDDMTDEQVHELIFHPGFSTAEAITDVSGRGVGMDVVKRTIMRLQGNIKVDSSPGEGTTFTIKLPLSTSIINGLLVKMNSELYVLPILEVVKIYELNREAHQSGNAFLEEIYVNNRFFELLNIQEVLNGRYLIALKMEEGKYGLLVDEIIEQVQAVVKPMRETEIDHSYLNGSCILGDGTLALVLNLEELLFMSKSRKIVVSHDN